MKIRIEQNVEVIWKCLCNSAVHHTTAKVLPKNIKEFKSEYIPQIDEQIYFSDTKERFYVKELIRNIGNEEEYFIVIPQSKVMYVDYYDYMKKYTHFCDSMKSDNDPTKDLPKVNDEVVFPDTWDEWERRKKAISS